MKTKNKDYKAGTYVTKKPRKQRLGKMLYLSSEKRTNLYLKNGPLFQI